MGIKKFFNPKTIAIIGASPHEEKVGGILMKNALKSKCKIVPVNPSHDEIFGIKCYSKLSDFEGKVDLVVIAIRSKFVADSFEECGKKGIKNIILVTAGFSEIGNVEDEKKIIKIAEKYGMRFIGPNCFGVFSSELDLDLTFSLATPKKGDIAFISQSGALWSFMADKFKNIGFRGFVGLGNMKDLEFCDFIEYFSEDKNTKSIILYIEKLKDGRKFIGACANAEKKGKKIYAVKAGSSKEGSKAAFSHTASIASDYLIYKGMFKQAGVILCRTLEEAVSFASGKKIKIDRKEKLNMKKVEIITNAGGAGALASDYLAEKGIKVLSDKDIIGTALAEDYRKALNDIKDDCSIIVILTGQSMSEIEKTAQIICDFKRSSGKNVVALFLGGESMLEAGRIFEENSVLWFGDFEGFVTSI